MAMTVPPMAHSSSLPGLGGGDASSAFDLPPMPVPYEDFHFSLDLPDNVNAADLSLLQNSTDFESLFGTSSAIHTPNIVSGSALFGSATPLIRTPAPLAPREPVLPLHRTEGSSVSSSERAVQQPMSEDAMMTSMQLDTPASSVSSSSTLRAGPPPPPDFEPPQASGEGTFSFSSLFGNPARGNDAFEHSQYPVQQQQQSMSGPSASMDPSYHTQALKGNYSASVQPLFEPSESDFLSNFLEGFESSWNFKPALPDNMPSFAAAAAHQVGPSGYAGVPDYKVQPASEAANPVVTGRSASGNASRKNRSAKKSTITPPREKTVQYNHPQHMAATADSSFAAFGGHLDEMEEDDDTEGGVAPLGSKRMLSRGTGGEPKRRGSLAHLDGGKATSGGHLTWKAGTQSFEGGHRPHPSLMASHSLPSGMMLQRPPPPASVTSSSKNPDRQRKPETPTATSDSGDDASTPSKDLSASRRDLLTDKEKRQNHIMSEQRRRNHIREGFAELVSLLDLGRSYGARGLGLSSGAGTGIEDEGLDDRTDVSSDEDSDEEAAALAKARRKKARAKRAALLAAAAASGNGAASVAARGRGKGRGRGGSAGGGAGSKSAVLFQAVDLVKWLEVRNETISEECRILEEEAGMGSGPVPLVDEGTTAAGAATETSTTVSTVA